MASKDCHFQWEILCKCWWMSVKDELFSWAQWLAFVNGVLNICRHFLWLIGKIPTTHWSMQTSENMAHELKSFSPWIYIFTKSCPNLPSRWNNSLSRDRYKLKWLWKIATIVTNQPGSPSSQEGPLAVVLLKVLYLPLKFFSCWCSKKEVFTTENLKNPLWPSTDGHMTSFWFVYGSEDSWRHPNYLEILHFGLWPKSPAMALAKKAQPSLFWVPLELQPEVLVDQGWRSNKNCLRTTPKHLLDFDKRATAQVPLFVHVKLEVLPNSVSQILLELLSVAWKLVAPELISAMKSLRQQKLIWWHITPFVEPRSIYLIFPHELRGSLTPHGGNGQSKLTSCGFSRQVHLFNKSQEQWTNEVMVR